MALLYSYIHLFFFLFYKAFYINYFFYIILLHLLLIINLAISHLTVFLATKNKLGNSFPCPNEVASQSRYMVELRCASK